MPSPSGVQKVSKVILHPIHSINILMMTAKYLEMLAIGDVDIKFSILTLGDFSLEKIMVVALSPSMCES